MRSSLKHTPNFAGEKGRIVKTTIFVCEWDQIKGNGHSTWVILSPRTKINGLEWSGHGNSMQEKNNHKKFIEIFGKQKNTCVRSL